VNGSKRAGGGVFIIVTIIVIVIVVVVVVIVVVFIWVPSYVNHVTLMLSHIALRSY
jgi:hypothetical protein